MNCHEVIERAYEFEGNAALPLLTHLRIQLHLLHCVQCAGEIERLESARLLMTGSFFPPAPEGLEERIMRSVSLEDQMEEFPDATGVSFRNWVVTGLIILVSLSTSFLGMDFSKVADHWGSSFLLPIGITIGGVVSAYGALFIGSHLKELSDRFNLH